ncbi:hypothetical protein Tco_0928220 [Tanacetum coccineum]
MTMEILPEPTSNNLCGRSDTHAANPVKEILLNLNLPDHREFNTTSWKSCQGDSSLKTKLPDYRSINPMVVKDHSKMSQIHGYMLIPTYVQTL